MDPIVQLEDVYRFEDALKAGIKEVEREKLKFEAHFLVVILYIIIAWNGIAISHLIWLYMKGIEVSLWIFVPTISGGAFLLVFFVSGSYTTRIVYGRRYVSRCNIVLQRFNIFFERESGKLIILKKNQVHPQGIHKNLSSNEKYY